MTNGARMKTKTPAFDRCAPGVLIYTGNEDDIPSRRRGDMIASEGAPDSERGFNEMAGTGRGIARRWMQPRRRAHTGRSQNHVGAAERLPAKLQERPARFHAHLS